MIVIENGTVVDPSRGLHEECDVLIEGAAIKAIDRPGSFGALDAQERINARGLLVLPGLIDLHVHLREPGFEWKETIASGSEAAALGGFTSVCCMPNTKPVNDCAQITRFIRERAAAVGLTRVLPIGAISCGLQGKELSPLSELRHAGCVAFSDDGEPVADAGMMRRALEWSLMFDVPLSCHEEEKSLSCGGCMNESALSHRLGLRGFPKVAEEVMVARDIELARTTGARVHICHISSGRSVELVRRAKADGIRVTCEVTPHHLVLSEDAVESYDTNAKMSPPLREWHEVEALRAGLRDGTIDAIASDHAPHEEDSKRVEFGRATFGILGLQTSLPLALELVRDGVLSLERAVEAFTIGPARAFRLPYGTLAPGSPADVTIVDPERSWSFSREVVRSLSFNSPFLGRELKGAAHTVLLEGVPVVRDGALVQRIRTVADTVERV